MNGRIVNEAIVQKKTPAHGRGVKPFMLSHIKAPLREEKRGANAQGNVTKPMRHHKPKFT
jgi:hypothetical protein